MRENPEINFLRRNGRRSDAGLRASITSAGNSYEEFLWRSKKLPLEVPLPVTWMVRVMRKKITPANADSELQNPDSSAKESSWIEEYLTVESAEFFPEELPGGKTALSVRLELAGEPDSSSNTRNRTEIQLVFGLEEKDVLTISRLLGRKVMLTQQRDVTLISKEHLAKQLSFYKEELAKAEDQINYLNDSLHRAVAGSRRNLAG
jgi:hypothetical protein